MDWLDSYPTETQRDPWGPVEGPNFVGERVLRGGDYMNFAHHAEAFNRYWAEPREVMLGQGFRVVIPGKGR